MQHVSYLERNRGHSIWRVFGRRQCAPGRGHPISQKASFAGVVPGPAVIACRRRAWRLDSLRLIDLPGKALQSLLATYSHFLRLCWLVSLLSCSRKASSCGRGHLFSRPARDDLLPQCHADVVHICLRRLHGRRADSRGDPVAAAAPPARPCQPRAGQQPAPAGHAPVRWRAVLRDRRIVWRATHGDAPAPVAHHRAYDRPSHSPWLLHLRDCHCGTQARSGRHRSLTLDRASQCLADLEPENLGGFRNRGPGGGAVRDGGRPVRPRGTACR